MARLFGKGGEPIMLLKLRENIFIGDENAGNLKELASKGITAVVVVADELLPMLPKASGLKIFKIGMLEGPNYGYVKDLACHVPKYLTQNGEKVLIQSKTGLKRGAFIAARTVCELENKSIYEVFQEIKEMEPKLDLGKVYF